MADPVPQKATTGGAGEEAVNILPYPPPLEFPYPRKAAQPKAPTASRPFHDSDLTTPSRLEHAKAPPSRPAGPKRDAVTERPAPIQRTSLLGIKRQSTFVPQNKAYNSANWDLDSCSSSDEEVSSSNHKSKKVNKAPPKATRSHGDTKMESNDPYRRFAVGNDGYKTQGKVSKQDGRLKISLKETATKGYLAKTLEATLKHQMGPTSLDHSNVKSSPRDDRPLRPTLGHAGTTSTIDSAASMSNNLYDPGLIPRLNICIMVIGSRGDIQPFLRLGKILAEDYGHRVRIATHPAFRDFVENESSLDFFSVGGDPAELMAFMVKNPGLIPKAKTIRDGEIAKRREAMYEMFQGFWRACINTTGDEHDTANLKMMGGKHPFVADAIIANPPSFAHVHCAERLGIPLHLMFTFPMSPTQQFPHPLANVRKSNMDSNYTNFMSYPLVDMMTWQGLGDLVNLFRVRSLGLEPISTLWAPGQLVRMRVPYSYLWSPGLIPKPPDWGPEIDITGFVFLDLASGFEPAQELTDFLEAGEPPIYIGFGSVVVDDPEKFTQSIFEAVAKAGVRALVSKGWGGLGDETNVPENVFLLGNTPHDWLFPRVSAVVHHGGAGSTAIGLKCGKPTMIVPFFGDQPFWGAMVAEAGSGSEPVPYKHLNSDILAESIKTLLTPECQAHAREVAKKIAAEGDGAANAVKSFHRRLPLRGNHSMRCSILEHQVAVWWLKGSHVRLSSLAAEILVQKRKIKWSELELLRHYDWNDFEGPGEPLTGAGGAIVGIVGNAVQGIGGTPFRWASSFRKKEKHDKEKARRSLEAAQRPNGNSNDRTREFEPLDEVESPLHHHDRHSGTGDKLELPPANLGEGRLKQDLIKNFHAETGPLDPILKNGTDPDAVVQDPDLEEMLTTSESKDFNIASSLAAGTRKGVVKTSKALAKAPIDVSTALAQGFHNVPRLWGDETVRTPRRITGFKSGLLAARDELVFGVYDGWSDLLRQPIHGAKTEGAIGFAKGVGKGFGGFVLKDLAALAGASAYPLKGIQKEIGKDRQLTDFIREAHVIDGQKRLTDLSKKDLEFTIKAVGKGWHIICEVFTGAEQLEHSGLKGRISYRRHQKKWKRNAIFENVKQMDQALEASKQGKDIGKEFARHRRQVDKAQSIQTPRSADSGLKSPASKLTPRASKGIARRMMKLKSGRKPVDRAKDQKAMSEGASGAVDGPASEDGATGQRASTEIAGRQTGTAVIDQAVSPKSMA